MNFNSVSDSSGLCQDADFFVKTDTTKYPLVHKARSANEWLRKIAVWIWQSTGEWEFDDSNQTTLPIATRDMVDSQQDYALPTNVFKVDRLEVMDSSGNWRLVKQLDKSQITDEAMTEFLETAGIPQYYDLVGDSLMLYPKPSSSDVTLTSGLKLYLSRDISAFVSTDTTKSPGIPPQFHRGISLGMAYDYAIANGMDRKATTLKRALFGDSTTGDEGLKGEIKQFYGTRDRDMKPKFRIKIDNTL